MLKKLINKVKSLWLKLFPKKEEVNERMKRKIAAGHTNVSK